MTRKHIVAGNWKMNNSFKEGKELAKAVKKLKRSKDVITILGTPFIHLRAVGKIIKKDKTLKLAAQNCHNEKSGAFTGEISIPMLASVGVKYVIIGHSERREYFGEDDAFLAKKVDACLEGGLTPIFCCGENKAIREAGTHESYVAKQLENSLFHLSEKEFSKLVIAYEPIWAIGTGLTASSQQAQDMHHAIRKLIADQYGAAIAEATSILYGGSCKPSNAKELFSQPDVDGGLIGGAALNAEDFVAIVNSF
ncbi:MAG: triose-phosphate isomerase [Saprospiraceae bacterium]|nr:triose-phosphate isomerase [Saprospiraceae bacterium]MCB9325849.1 triose-phosphate isomerase [Lewinellaceae bacterium]